MRFLRQSTGPKWMLFDGKRAPTCFHPEPEVSVSTVMLAAMTLVLLNVSDCIFSIT